MADKETLICRICLEDSSTDMLMNPCKCNGSLSCVHEECLKTWLISKNLNLEDTKCEICQTDFVMRYYKRNKFSPVYACKTDISILFFLLLLSFVLSILLIIVYILAFSLVKGFNTAEECYFAIVLLHVCGISILIVAYLMVKSIREACFRLKIEDWKIYDQVFDGSLITERDTPKITSINGRKVLSADTSRDAINEFDYSELNDQNNPVEINDISDNQM